MKYAQEKGQALVEMCAGIIGMLSLFVGILFVSGLSITNIKTLQSSKVNAETTVLGTSDSSMIERRDIFDWRYQNDLPFTAADTPSYNTFNLDNLTNDYISNPAYSQAAGYVFTPLQNIEMRSDRTPEVSFFINSFDNYATAASLVQGNADSYDTLYSFRKQPAADRRALEEAIARWLGVDVSTLRANRLRSNQAYMPNFGRYTPAEVFTVQDETTE